MILGAKWMLFVVVRHEEHPLRYGLIALLPYSFIWYYIARIRNSAILDSVPRNVGEPKPSWRVFVIAVVLYTFFFWILLAALIQNVVATLALMVIFVPAIISAVGQMWMAYTVIRHEEDPPLYLRSCLIPFASVWYYYARVKRGKVSRNGPD